MASLPTLSRASSCLNCLRRSFTNDNTAFFSHPSRTQWRGKKKMPKRTTLNVRLLKDVAGYGREGFIVPVAPARMRNNWYPQGRARYVTAAEAKTQKAFVIERDYGFKSDEKSRMAETESKTPVLNANVSLLPPSRTNDLLQRFMPQEIEFRRQPIQTTPITSEGLAQPEAPEVAVPTTAIYGSVTMGDVATSIRALLLLRSSQEPDAARVVIAPEDIKVVSALHKSPLGGLSADEEAGRIKNLGEWTVAIQIKGGEQITRRLRVLPEAPEADITDDPTSLT